MIPRPVRNNNPGDLEAGDHWQGLVPASMLTLAQKHERFAVFEKPEWGFRALAILLHNYTKLYGANTVRKIVSRFAPPSENDTAHYADFVCDGMSDTLKRRVTPDTVVDVLNHDTMFALVKAMTRMETGSWEPYWYDTQLAKGLELAGIHNQGALVA